MTIKGTWRLGPLVTSEKEPKQDTEPEDHVIYTDDVLINDPLTRKDIIRVREKHGLTQVKLAEIMGVSLRTIKAWEHRDRCNREARNCTGAPRRLIQLIWTHGVDIFD